MKVAFLCPEMETLGVQYLSSVLKENGHQTKLFLDPQLFMDTVTRNPLLGKVFDYSDKILEDLTDYRSDLIAFSVLSTSYDWACGLSKKIKKHLDIPIVFGGIHPTSVPEEILKNEFVDFVIVGEGEYSLLDLVESGFDEKRLPSIRNLCYRENGKFIFNPLREPIKNLDLIPFPDKDLFYYNLPYLQKSYTILTGRGCPHQCTYCCNGFLNKLYNGRFLRRRSIANVITELHWAIERYKIKYIFFDDSTFTYDRQWLKSFSKEYKNEIGLTCFCWIYPTDMDNELIGLLKTMNCRAVEMGVESLDVNIRKNIFHRFYDNSDIESAITLLKKNKIFCIVDNIKGFSNNLEKEMIDTVKFYNMHRPNKIYIFEHRSFPKTEIMEIIAHNNNSSVHNMLPFTIATSSTSKRTKQLETLLILTYFMPKRWIDFLLNKRIYCFFPSLSSYNILEILPYFINLFKMGKYRIWYPIRGTRRRYLHYFLSTKFYFIRRILHVWG